MNSPLTGPGDRYRLAVEGLVSQDGKHFTRYVAEAGIPVSPSSFLVMVDEACSLLLQPGENGVTVRDVRLLNACHVRLAARVTPGLSPPDWLPNQSEYLLFDGDHKEACGLPARYVPFDGLVSPDAWPHTDFAPLDVLAVAVGRSIERANAILACTPSPGGTALVSTVTVRVGVSRFNLARNRVLVTLSGENGGADQFVELTLTTGFAAAEEADVAEEGLAAAATVGAEVGALGGAAATVLETGAGGPGPAGGQT